MIAFLSIYLSFTEQEKRISAFYNREIEITAVCTSVEGRNSFSARYTAETMLLDGMDKKIDVLLITSGGVLEQGDVEEVYNNPKHPYTKKLLDAAE